MSDNTVQITPRRVWIDTDPAILSGNGEVDDGYALLQALNSPELDVVGVSAVFGNTALENTYPMAKDLLARAGRRDIPVYKGHAVADARELNDATRAMTAALAEGPMTIAALGPLTNVAAALRAKDVPLGKVEEIVFVGGRRTGLEFRATPHQEIPFRDLNFELDAKAARDLLALNVPITLAGWEVSSKMWLQFDHLEILRREGDAATKWLADASQAWLENWVREFNARGFTPFDTLAIGWLLRPELFDIVRWPAEVTFTVEPPLFQTDPSIDGRAVTYLKGVDNDEFRNDLMARLLKKFAD